MFGHLPELAIVLVIALIVFGPERLPEVAANAGKMIREVRSAMDTAMNPKDPEADDFSSYYYESAARSGEEVPPEDGPWPGAQDISELEAHFNETFQSRTAIEESPAAGAGAATPPVEDTTPSSH
ncbi:MAG: Sec-independent protein translocase subunit TatA/TatB [Chloroflexota bacterium]